MKNCLLIFLLLFTKALSAQNFGNYTFEAREKNAKEKINWSTNPENVWLIQDDGSFVIYFDKYSKNGLVKMLNLVDKIIDNQPINSNIEMTDESNLSKRLIHYGDDISKIYKKIRLNFGLLSMTYHIERLVGYSGREEFKAATMLVVADGTSLNGEFYIKIVPTK